jgi:hypothetical protein
MNIMKVRGLMNNKLCLLALSILMAMSFAACSDDDNSQLNDNGSKVDLPESRVYILNEGTKGQNNAGIAFYDPNKKVATLNDIFYKQNSSKLGDTGQDIITYKNNIYVSVNGSNYITMLNSAGVLQKSLYLSASGDNELTGGVRYLAAEDGYIYASLYGGVVLKINANTLTIDSKIKGLGNNLEGVTICNNELYVANSYKVENGKYIYLTDVFVIDLSSFKLKKTLTVTQNPNQLVTENGKVFLISWDYSSESYVLQMIDPSNDYNVSKLGYATNMAAGAADNTLYLIDSRTDYSNWPVTSTANSFSTYNINTKEIIKTSFLKNAPSELTNTSISTIKINPENGDIYIATTYYSTANGNIYRFKKDGTFIEKFDCGGQNPNGVAFFN